MQYNSCRFENSCAYFHPEKSDLIDKEHITEIRAKVQNIESIMNKEVAQLKATNKLLTEKVNT